MHIISKKALVQFWDKEPNAKEALKAWYSISNKTDFENFAHIRRMFGSADKVGKFIVFDMGGNKYRLVTIVHFKYRKLYIRAVLTHKEYDKEHWKRE